MGHLPYDVMLKAVLWIIGMILLIINGIFMLIKGAKNSKEQILRRKLFNALGIFFLLNLGVILFFIISDFEHDLMGDSNLYLRFLGSAYTIGILSFLPVIIVGEKFIIPWTNRSISISAIVIIILNALSLWIFIDFIFIMRYINYIFLIIEAVIIIYVYIYIIKHTEDELKRIAIYTLSFLGISAIAVVLEMDALISSGLVSPFISPILFPIGLSLFTITIRKKQAIDVLELVANYQMTTLDQNFLNRIEQLGFKAKEKIEFIKDMLGLTPLERENFISQLEKKSDFNL